MRSRLAVLLLNCILLKVSEWMLSPVSMLLLCFFVGVLVLFLLILGCILCTAHRRRRGAKSNAIILSSHKRTTTSKSGSPCPSLADLPGISLDLGNGDSLFEADEGLPHVSAPIPRRIGAEFSQSMLIVELPRVYQPAHEDRFPLSD